MKRPLYFPGSAPDILHHGLSLPQPLPELEGRPIAFLSDLHYGFFLGWAMATFDMVMAYKPASSCWGRSGGSLLASVGCARGPAC